MYEKHFGLKSRPFGSKAVGADVFVGPEQAKTIASLQKGLGAPDAVVTVTGPVGVGKTTIVNRALETLPTGRTAAQIGRMHLTAQEVIDLLMGGFGIKQSLQGSIRRFAAFRRLLQAQSESGIPVAIIIEDPVRLGVEALAEVEALTAADAGDAASANIILMGQPELHELFSSPGLARLKQRIRLRQKVAPLSLAEVQGYLKHSIREAGGDYNSLFDKGVAEIIHGCSEGVPRVINTICETALTAAMEEHSARVTAAMMSQIAADVFGYESDSSALPEVAPVMNEPVAISPPAGKDISPDDQDIDWETPPKPETEASAEAVTNDAEVGTNAEIGCDIIVESGSYPGPAETLAAGTNEQTSSNDTDPELEETNLHAIPELINDTQPELPELQVAAAEEFDDIPVLKPDINADVDDAKDIESTQTLAQPAVLAGDEAVNPAPAVEPAAGEEDSDKSADEEEFDLDAALSPEVDETNVMRGITPNLDQLAMESHQAEPEAPVEAPVAKPATEPTAAIAVPRPAPIPETKPVTRPETAAVAPNKKPEAVRVSRAKPLVVATPDDNDLPTLSNSMRVDVKKEVQRAEKLQPKAAPAPELPPASDATTNAPAMKDPLSITNDPDRKSDIDALEAALAAAKNGVMAGRSDIPAISGFTGAAPELSVRDQPDPMPEISLDRVIADQKRQNDQLDKFRAEIGNAHSLEDISDVMAETLFGCEAFDEIAADVVANPPGSDRTEALEEPPSPVKLTDDEMPGAANDSTELSLENEQPAEPESVAAQKSDVPLNESTALRIDMLNKMKSKAANMAENVELGEDDPAKKTGKPKGPQPEPIENQISTSITQTLEALNVSKFADAVPAEKTEKAEKKSGGLFSRFKRSS